MTHAEFTTSFPATAGITNTSRSQVIAGRVLSAVAVVFLTFDGLVKLIPNPMVTEASLQIGYPVETVFGIGVLLLVCVGIYLIPRTSALGALLLTAYLGGAVATHVRIGSPLLTHVLFPTYVAAFVWGGLLLRKPSLRVLLTGGR